MKLETPPDTRFEYTFLAEIAGHTIWKYIRPIGKVSYAIGQHSHWRYYHTESPMMKPVMHTEVLDFIKAHYNLSQ